MATDYRDEALKHAFPEVSKLGLKVRSQVNSDPWVVNAKDLDRVLKSQKSKRVPLKVLLMWWTLVASFGLLVSCIIKILVS